MKKIVIKKEYSCFIFGEGRKDKDFLITLIDLDKFKYHTERWIFNYGNASGGSAKTILEKCCKEVSGYDYHLVLCFIDLDRFKDDFNKEWKKEKIELEKKYSDIKIIWQLDNLEDEFKKVIGNQHKSKHRLNKLARQKINGFINSNFWKRILNPIKNKEQELDKIQKKLKNN